MLHIALAAEHLWTIGGFAISNSLLTTWVVMAVLVLFSVFATRKLSLKPSSIQVVAEAIVGGLYDFFGSIAGHYISQFFPIIASLFIYILLANWIGLLPGVGTVGFYRTEKEPVVAEATVSESSDESNAEKAVTTHETQPSVAEPVKEAGDTAKVTEEKAHEEKTEFVPLFRGATSDLNTTIALAIISVLAMQYFGFRNLGGHYSKRFINFKDPIMFSVGILEIISDISKIMSFAFRLFGNIFAGEVLLSVIAFLIPFIVPLPFLLMELFVGVVQALVFSMLSTAFFMVAVAHEE